jgi:type I restriction enzyme S subunit
MFGEVFDFLATASNSRAELNESGTVLYVHYGDIHKRWNHLLDFAQESLPRIKSSKVKSAALLRDGDLILADASEDPEGVGKSVEVKNINGAKAVAGLHTFLLRDRRQFFAAGYTGYIQSNASVKESLDRIATGLKVYGVSKNALKSVTLPVPPLHEQRDIAAALSDVDDLISALDELIAKKRAVKTATMQQLLTGKQRLPGFSREWEAKRLGDVSAIKTGKKNNEDKHENGRYPFFVRSQTVERINTYSFDGEAVLVPGEGGIGSIFHYVNGKFDYHQRVYKISDFNADTCGKFIYYAMIQTFNKQAMRNSVKATVDSLRLPTFLGFEIFAPSLEEQTAIAIVLSDMDAEIEALEARREKTRQVKRGMMQELLTGRTRLV